MTDLKLREDAERTAGPFVRWIDYGYEGWKPDSFPTIEAALHADNYGNRFVITRVVSYRIVETKEQGPKNPVRVAAGRARAAALTPERRTEIARTAANKRWAQ